MRLILRRNGSILKQAVIEVTKKSNVLNLFLSMNNAGHPQANLFIIIITHVNTSFKRRTIETRHMAFRFRKGNFDQMCMWEAI